MEKYIFKQKAWVIVKQLCEGEEDRAGREKWTSAWKGKVQDNCLEQCYYVWSLPRKLIDVVLK